MIDKLINEIKTNPMSRRLIMNLWQEEDFKKSEGLLPCAFMTTWNVRGEYLDCTLHQRSQDFGVICGINTIQYMALQMMIAQSTGYRPGKFTHIIDNLHVYNRHIPLLEEMCNRRSLLQMPKLTLDKNVKDFYEFTIDDFKVFDYENQGNLNNGRFDLGI